MLSKVEYAEGLAVYSDLHPSHPEDCAPDSHIWNAPPVFV